MKRGSPADKMFHSKYFVICLLLILMLQIVLTFYWFNAISPSNHNIEVATVFLYFLGLLILLGLIKDKRKQFIGFSIGIMLLIVSGVAYLIMDRQPYGGSTFSYIKVGYASDSGGFDICEDFGLNYSIAPNFGNSTLTLSITETTMNKSIYYHYTTSNNRAVIGGSEAYNYLHLNYVFNYSYNLSFHYILTSRIPEISDILIMKPSNYLNLSVSYASSGGINIKLDPEFRTIPNRILTDEYGRVGIWIVDSQVNAGMEDQIIKIKMQHVLS
jgi:hypothetical protein